MSLSDPGLDREAADRALERLDGESDRIAEALVAMDGHPGHELLRVAALTGRTKDRWAEIAATMATLWVQFDAYRALLDRAREVRARKVKPGQAELDELTALLTGDVVELNREQVPIERRGLTGPAVTAERISLAELVARMKAGYATVTAVLAEVDASTAAALHRIDELEAALQAARSAGNLPALDRIRDRLTDARDRVAGDPLGFAAHNDLAELGEQLEALRAVRETYDERVGRIAATLGEIEATRAEAHRVAADVAAKIATAGLPPIADRTPALRDELTALHREPDWLRLATELDRLDRAAAAALNEAKLALRNLTGLLDRRAELRGRLDAYRAKAERLGRAEDLALAGLHDRAHALLFTAPCDLAAATRAVNRYQRAVQEGAR
jgi:hypothetical protein